MPDFSLPLEYYLIPFLIIVGICLILIVVFMVDKDVSVSTQIPFGVLILKDSSHIHFCLLLIDHQVCSGSTQGSKEPLTQRSAEETSHPQVQERYADRHTPLNYLCPINMTPICVHHYVMISGEKTCSIDLSSV